MSRSSCLNCCRKHLSQALVLMLEVPQGYPIHGWIAVGHMGEASDEMIDEYPALAERIREERLAYMSSLDAAMSFDETDGLQIDLEKLYRASMTELLYDVTIQALSEL